MTRDLLQYVCRVSIWKSNVQSSTACPITLTHCTCMCVCVCVCVFVSMLFKQFMCVKRGASE